MQYRQFGKTDFQVSTFGMGNMRLPTMTNAEGKTVIDREKAIAMIRHAVDSGVNYLDTAYVYHNQESEEVVGLALKDGYRERTKIATKLPVMLLENAEQMPEMLKTSMDRLGVDYIDYFLLHALNRNSWEKCKKLGAVEFIDKAKKDGLIKNACFSFHDDLDTFKSIVDYYDWDMAQIQLNYLDMFNQAGVEGLKYAASRGLGVVIMEPLRGGRLANVPAEVKAIFDSYGADRSPIEWAFRWLYNMPEVSCILSGVSTMEQLCDNLEIFDRSGIGVMTDEEQAVVMKAKEAFEKRIPIPCTGCAYCMPCPAGISIPDVLRTYNEGYMYDDFASQKGRYGRLVSEGKDASQCVGCQACEQVCPQHIKVSEWMQTIQESALAK